MKSTSQLKVSIITVNFNQLDHTRKLIRSLNKITYKNIEIIVVDNASRQNCAPLLKSFPHIKLVRSTSNRGFAGGNNLGLKYAQGQLILFINNDVLVLPDFLDELVNQLELDPEALACSPKIKYLEAPQRIQYAGGERVHPITLRNKHLGHGAKDIGQHNRSGVTAYAHGACMLVRSEAIELVGEMDEDYFLYYEEQDWCERLLRQGKKILYVASATVFHDASTSTGKGSPMKTYYLTRNRILFARKRLSRAQKLISFGYLLLVSVPYNFLKNIRSKEHLRAYFQGIFWHWKHKTI